MASNTSKFDLHKKDPVLDAEDTFNIQTMLNENWDKVDKAAKGAPLSLDASSLNEEGDTGHRHALSMATKAEAETGTNNTKLVTPIRVKEALKAHLPKGTATIPVTGWTAHTGENALKLNLPISGVVVGDWVDLTVGEEFQKVAQDAEINGTVVEYNGGVILFANSVPSVEIPVRYKVVK